jgi:hypothetical protein
MAGRCRKWFAGVESESISRGPQSWKALKSFIYNSVLPFQSNSLCDLIQLVQQFCHFDSMYRSPVFWIPRSVVCTFSLIAVIQQSSSPWVLSFGNSVCHTGLYFVSAGGEDTSCVVYGPNSSTGKTEWAGTLSLWRNQNPMRHFVRYICSTSSYSSANHLCVNVDSQIVPALPTPHVQSVSTERESHKPSASWTEAIKCNYGNCFISKTNF